MSPGRLGKILLGLAVSAALLIYFFRDVDLAVVMSRLGQTIWTFLALSVVLNFASIWMRAWRWYYLFPPGARPTHLFRALVIGYMGNNLLPLRAGELVRIYVASRRGPRFWTTFATVVVERVLDGLAVGLIVAALLLVGKVPPELRWSIVVFLGVDLLGLLIVAALAAAPGACRVVVETLFHRFGWLERRLLALLETMTEGLKGLREASHLLPIAGFSVAVWAAFALSIWTALHAAHLDLPVMAAWTVVAFLGLGVSLPSSPGFVGIVQAATVLALALFAVPRTEALSFSLLMHASQFFPVTAVGLLYLFTEQISLTDATRVGTSRIASER
jgi:uncharacterized protein (TIRG00374 family)